MPDNTSFDPWDSLAESLGAKPAADTPQLPPSTQPPPSAQTRSREKPPIAKQPPAEPASGGWDALADSLGMLPHPSHRRVRRNHAGRQNRPNHEPNGLRCGTPRKSDKSVLAMPAVRRHGRMTNYLRGDR